MTAQAEHAEAPSVVRIVELVGVSNKSWSDAAQQAVTRASETIRRRHRSGCPAQLRRRARWQDHRESREC